MEYSTWVEINQVALPAAEVLTDERFPWRERKMKTVRLADLYERIGYYAYAERARTCATWLQYQVSTGGDRRLSAANFCQLRLCPMCTARRAKKSALKLSKVLDMVEDKTGAMFLFLTLTMKNVSGDELPDALSQLTKGWYRLMDNRQIERSIPGWFRAIEITRKGKGYHPHLHAILAVRPSYFSRKSEEYIRQDEWVARWRKALRVDYNPSVRIQVTKARGEVSGGHAATLEAAKYAVKDEEYIDPKLPIKTACEILKDYTDALHRRRLTAFGGWMKAAAVKLDAEIEGDGDLVHVEDDTIREDVAELIETYNWNFGAGDYILSDRMDNPLKVVREEL